MTSQTVELTPGGGHSGSTPAAPPESDLIPLALIAAEVGESVDRLAHRFGEAVTVDDIGMRAVRADVARQFFTGRAEWKAQHDEKARRRREELAEKSRPLAGVPAQEGMTPFEAMAAAGEVVSPSEEFGGRPSPNFLEEELAAGRRAAAEKERRVEQMKKDLR